MFDAENCSVYVVAGRDESRVNDRVVKLLSLRTLFHSITLVTPGARVSDSQRLRVPPVIGATGLLRVFGLNRIKASIDRYLYFPSLDMRFVWSLEKALANRLKLDLDAGRDTVVVVTFPPHALGRLAVHLKKRLPQVRIVLDWQDLWSFDPNYADRSPALYQKRIRRWEQQFIESADLHLATNKRAAAVLVEHYSAPTERVSYIEHHFHPDDLVSETQLTPPVEGNDAPVRLAFMGTLDKPPRVPGRELLDVVRRVNANGRRIELHVYGNIPALTAEERQQALEHGITFHGLVSHEEATQAMLEYDVLCLLLADMPNSRVVLSIKLPHYLLANKPILAVVPGDSAIADVVSSTGAGLVVDSSPDAAVDWQTSLSQLLEDEQRLLSLDAKRSQSAVDAYHWDNIAPRWLAAITGKQTSGNSL